MKRFDEIAIGPDTWCIDRYPWYWWPARMFQLGLCKITRCWACSHFVWLHRLEHQFINSPNRVEFEIPIDHDMRMRLAESYGIELRDKELEDDE